MSDALHEFTSHIEGRNARVAIFPDRIEWEKPRSRSLMATTVTLGANFLVKRGVDTEMIPMRSVTSVATRRDGMVNTVVSVITSGNTIDFRVSHKEAAQVKDVLNGLLLN